MRHTTARGYAAYLATYISSPITIESLVKREWTYAPPLHEIAEMRYQVEQSRKPRRGVDGRGHPITDEDLAEGDVFDDLQWQPATFVPKDHGKPQPTIVDVAPPAKMVEMGDLRAMVNFTEKLITSVAFDFDVSPQSMMSPSRKRTLIFARAVVVMLLRRRGWSYPRIARAIGRTDHSTTINAVRHFDDYAARDERVTESFERHLRLLNTADQDNEPCTEAEAA